MTAAARPRRRYPGSTSIAVSPAQCGRPGLVPATRPMATVRPPSRTEANACQGAEVTMVRAIGGRLG